MRQLSLQEVEVVSGADKPVVDFTINDLLKWGAAYLGGTNGFAAGASAIAAHPLVIPGLGLDAAKWGVGGLGGALGGALGYAAGHFFGQLFQGQVVSRVGG